MLRVTALSKIAFNSYLCLQLLISIATSRLPYFQMKSLFLQLFAIIVSPYYVILGLIIISTESYYYTVTGLFNIEFLQYLLCAIIFITVNVIMIYAQHVEEIHVKS